MQNETAYNEQLNESAFTLISRKQLSLQICSDFETILNWSVPHICIKCRLYIEWHDAFRTNL